MSKPSFQIYSRNLLTRDFYSALKRIVGKVTIIIHRRSSHTTSMHFPNLQIEAGKETRIGHEILISFMTNFLSKVSNFKDDKGSVGHLFKSKLKDLVLSSRLDR